MKKQAYNVCNWLRISLLLRQIVNPLTRCLTPPSPSFPKSLVLIIKNSEGQVIKTCSSTYSRETIAF